MVYFFVVIVVCMSWTLRLVMGAKLWRCQRQIRFSMQNNIGFNFYFHVCSDGLISHCEAFSCSRKRKNKMIETTAMAFPVWFLVIEQTKKKIIKKMFGVQQHTLNDTIFGHLRWCWPEPSARRLQCASKHNTHTHISQSPMMNYRLIGCMHLINSIDKRSKDHAHLLFAVVVVLAGCSFACLLKKTFIPTRITIVFAAVPTPSAPPACRHANSLSPSISATEKSAWRSKNGNQTHF